jgi:hypothetical protein
MEAKAAGEQVRIASVEGGDEPTPGSIAQLVDQQAAWLGPPPLADGKPLSVLLVPAAFMRGGAAGRRSIVQPPDPIVLAHEVFHWWNGPDGTDASATWFREGFTEYYGVKTAQAGSLIDEQAGRACLADLHGEMRHLEADGPVSLEDASLQARKDSRSRRLVYSKGALLAWHLDELLAKEGRSLDEGMRAVLTQLTAQGKPLGSDAVLEAFQQTYGDLVNQPLRAAVEGDEPLPSFDLPPATGQSGCARYLP